MNRQNNRTWAQTNPCVIVENPLHAARVTVWAGLASWGVVGPFYFEEEGNGGPVTVTVNSARYGAMLRGLDSVRGNFPDWNDRTWFQQDGAPPPPRESHHGLLEADLPRPTYIPRWKCPVATQEPGPVSVGLLSMGLPEGKGVRKQPHDIGPTEGKHRTRDCSNTIEHTN